MDTWFIAVLSGSGPVVGMGTGGKFPLKSFDCPTKLFCQQSCISLSCAVHTEKKKNIIPMALNKVAVVDQSTYCPPPIKAV